MKFTESNVAFNKGYHNPISILLVEFVFFEVK